jgi:hypothetical protein
MMAIKDNRVPSVIRQFAGKSEARNVLSCLSFQDWFEAKENEAKDWTVVARSWKDETTDLFTFSALAATTNGNLEKLLSRPDWDVRLEFGKPYFYSHGGEEILHYDPGLTTEVNGIEFKPLVIHRYLHGFVPTTFELVQNFILYHEAFFFADENEYRRVDDYGDIHTIARIIREEENRLIAIDTHHLRDYLAANKCYLVRYHDHRRSAVEDIGEYIKGRFASYDLTSEYSRFDLWLRTDIPRDKYKSSSRLLGKDIVQPYLEPDKSHFWLAKEDENKKSVHFIIDRDDQGKDIESTCNQDELSNYFTDRGTPHFLTPTFFKREVLFKYYQEPSRYTVSDSGVACLDLWHVPIDITNEDLVQVWLGDLGHLPYKEQLHWRQFNVHPKGSITRHRWLRDFMAEFADPTDDPVYYFRVAFEEIQKESKQNYGAELFHGLDKKDKHAYETLHLPLTEEWKEFDEQVQAMAKVTVDSLNVELLSRETGQKIDRSLIKGSIDLLGIYLDQLTVSTDTKQQILNAFHAVQTIRSTGAAHRKGANFTKALKRFQIDNLSNRKRIRSLITNLTKALSSIAKAIRKSQDA